MLSLPSNEAATASMRFALNPALASRRSPSKTAARDGAHAPQRGLGRDARTLAARAGSQATPQRRRRCSLPLQSISGPPRSHGPKENGLLALRGSLQQLALAAAIEGACRRISLCLETGQEYIDSRRI